MRIALLADIHGNLPAFEATLAHARAQSPDLLLLLGDYCTGPDPLGCWQLAQSLGCPLLRGNHERYLYGLHDPASPALWRSEQFLPMQWTHAQLPASARDAMRALPMDLQLPQAPGVHFAHATPASDSQVVRAHMSLAELDAALTGLASPMLLRGHEHFAREISWRGRRVVTVASVGLPLDMDPRAAYAILDVAAGETTVTHQLVAYDLGRTLRRFHDSGWLRDAGVMGRVYFLEFKLSVGMLLPFLNWHARWKEAHGFTLEQTFARLYGPEL